MPRTAKAVSEAPKFNIAATLKDAAAVIAANEKATARKDKLLASQAAEIEKLKAKLEGSKAKAVVAKSGKRASADDADVPAAKRVKATAAVEAPKGKPGRKPKAEVVAEAPKGKPGRKPKVEAAVEVKGKPGRKPKAEVAAPAPKGKPGRKPKASTDDDSYLL